MRMQAPHEPHLLGPFTGLTICLSGGAPANKQAAVALVKQNGAKQSPDLNKTCTHLVICSGGPRQISPKEKCACAVCCCWDAGSVSGTDAPCFQAHTLGGVRAWSTCSRQRSAQPACASREAARAQAWCARPLPNPCTCWCRAARSWGITLVWDSWVKSTVEAGLYLEDEDKHAVQPEYVPDSAQGVIEGSADGRPVWSAHKGAAQYHARAETLCSQLHQACRR